MGSFFKDLKHCIKLGIGGMCFLMLSLPNAALAKQAKPLFSSDDVIKIKLVAPFSDLKRKASRSTEPYDGRLTVVGLSPESHVITLAARGNSRRRPDVCKFPPLRVKFPKKPDAASLFAKQKSLKLVTHCQSSKSQQKYALLEYSVYRLYNVLTPESLKVRMAEIDYVETTTGKVIITRYGFFIEDADDAAKRNNMKEIDQPTVSREQLSTDAAARYGLFQYMISNLDWSVKKGPTGRDCCHNTKLIGATKTSVSNIKPVPYDFDYSGLVNAPYAAPPEGIKVSSVKTRRYRGYCVHNDAVQRQAAMFLANRPEFERVISTVPALSDKDKSKAASYLASFFKTLDDPNKFSRQIIGKCRS